MEITLKTLLQSARQLSVLLLLSASTLCFADAEFEVEYIDSSGSGFNSVAPASPVGGNTGTTLGEQRRIALEFALNQFAQSLDTSVPIHIEAGFQNFGGSERSAVLASAGPEWFNYNFSNAPARNLAYPSALANKISGQDLSNAQEGIADIALTINEDVDGAALGTNTFYYGLDGNTTGFDINFVTVISHEILHGLGYISAIDLLSGHKYGCGSTRCNTNNIGDVYSSFLARQTTSQQPLLEMTQEARLAAVSADEQIVWTGPATLRASENLSRGTLQGHPLIYAPNPVELGSSLAHLDGSLSPGDLMQPFYSGMQGVSKINLAMLSDIGWGPAADLQANLSSLELEGTTNLTTTISNNGAEAAPEVSLKLTTNSGRITTNESLGCSGLDTANVTCTLGTLTAGQIINYEFKLVGQTEEASIHAQLSGNIVELDGRDNTAVETVAVPIIQTNGEPTPTTSSQETTTPSQASNQQGSDAALPSSTMTQPEVIKTSSGGSVSWLFILVVLLCRYGQNFIKQRSLLS